MSSSNSIFSGNSRYASDFQSVIDRAVAIASLPLNQLNAQKTTLQDQSKALASLDSKVASLGHALTALASAMGTTSYGTKIGDGSVVSASIGEGVRAGTYGIEVNAIGAFATALSKDGLPLVTDPDTASISNALSFDLRVGTGSAVEVKPESNTLAALADAINATSEAGVQATVVNIGSSSHPDYRLSLKSTKLGDTPISLSVGGEALVDAQDPPGAPAQYKIAGASGAWVESDSRSVEISPGLTVNLLKPGSTEVTITRTATPVSDALGSLVNAYNSVMAEIDQHRGTNRGALSGNSILDGVASAMREMAGYESGTGGSIDSLNSLGLGFDQNGRLSLDEAAFSKAVAGKTGALMTFLGSSEGGGFLKAAGGIVSALEDSSAGLVQITMVSVTQQISSDDARIAENQERVDQLRHRLEAQIAAADAAIAAMEQQVTYITNLFDTMSKNQSSR